MRASDNRVTLLSLGNSKLRQVDDFTYVGSWIDQKKRDIEICKEKAWAAGNKLTVVWKSNLNRDLKIHFFRASVASVCSIVRVRELNMTTALEKQLDRCYTRLLRAALNIHVSWRDHISHKELYGDLLPISESLQIHWLQFSGDCWRSERMRLFPN